MNTVGTPLLWGGFAVVVAKHPLRLNTINNATTGANQREQDLPVAIVNTPFTQKCAQRHLRA